MNMLKKSVRALLAGSLSLSLTLPGVTIGVTTVLVAPEAAYASSNVIKIGRYGPGATQRVKLGLNKAVVVDLPTDAHDILVSDPEMADAVTRTSRRIYLFGKTVGQTNVFIFGPNGEEITTLEIEIERDITGLEQNLSRFIPDSDIKVEIVSDNIVLTGTVRTPQDALQAEKLAEAFLKGGEATTRSSSAASSAQGGDVAIYEEDRQTSQIVNLLKIEGEDQVTLKVTVAEVTRSVMKQLGFSGALSGANAAIQYMNPTNLGSSINWAANAAVTGSVAGTDVGAYINAMERAGVMRTLAEPSLTAISGEDAKFYVGGEFRLASGQEIAEDGKVTRENTTTEYGIELNFTPVVLSPGRISLKIETNVSEPTFEDSFVTGATMRTPGVTYLGIRKREASTTVELPSGGSIVIAGLVRDDIRQAMSGLPGMSRIPILGTLFRSKDFTRNETELVIIATPYLVRPVARNALAKPDDNFNPASDQATFFLNRVNKVYGREEDTVQPGQFHGTVGFIYK
ncbi:type II and III secretion system protein family protein [Rhizobium sp. NRK18]|uniref:type II and III secretion system protein family protein n=1 Tax=Rhizobium sp. NRK18 TaxID=2964667 RepID=UPI003965B001